MRGGGELASRPARGTSIGANAAKLCIHRVSQTTHCGGQTAAAVGHVRSAIPPGSSCPRDATVDSVRCPGVPACSHVERSFGACALGQPPLWSSSRRARPAPPLLARDGSGVGVAWQPIKASSGPCARGRLSPTAGRVRVLPASPSLSAAPAVAAAASSSAAVLFAQVRPGRPCFSPAVGGWVTGTGRCAVRGASGSGRDGRGGAGCDTWQCSADGPLGEGPVPWPFRPLRNGSRQQPLEGGGRAPVRPASPQLVD